jgi:hypothetical protein
MERRRGCQPNMAGADKMGICTAMAAATTDAVNNDNVASGARSALVHFCAF